MVPDLGGRHRARGGHGSGRSWTPGGPRGASSPHCSGHLQPQLVFRAGRGSCAVAGPARCSRLCSQEHSASHQPHPQGVDPPGQPAPCSPRPAHSLLLKTLSQLSLPLLAHRDPGVPTRQPDLSANLPILLPACTPCWPLLPLAQRPGPSALNLGLPEAKLLSSQPPQLPPLALLTWSWTPACPLHKSCILRLGTVASLPIPDPADLVQGASK